MEFCWWETEYKYISDLPRKKNKLAVLKHHLCVPTVGFRVVFSVDSTVGICAVDLCGHGVNRYSGIFMLGRCCYSWHGHKLCSFVPMWCFSFHFKLFIKLLVTLLSWSLWIVRIQPWSARCLNRRIRKLWVVSDFSRTLHPTSSRDSDASH